MLEGSEDEFLELVQVQVHGDASCVCACVYACV